ncbi:hypothetical protein AMS68_001059 [Peltaster fructicola]|uniref:Uncharacterized protein n=1 Tax=Peltaster fructicola TaxID=286661 RepID=A0A6H0XLB6_9PEZI|nr:hypothetical protein AMS68_001059 [Peltaster fructicola]
MSEATPTRYVWRRSVRVTKCMPCHAKQLLHVHRGLRRAPSTWRSPQPCFSSSSRRQRDLKTDAEEDEPQKLVDELKAQYEQQQQYLQAQGDNSLLSMVRITNEQIRLQDALDQKLKSMPLADWEAAGLDTHRIALKHSDAEVAMRDLRSVTKEAREHMLDMFHDDYPLLDPYPFKKYQDKWSQRTRVEQEQELRRLNGVIAADSSRLDVLQEAVRALIVRQYGQAFVDEADAKKSSVYSLDPDEDVFDLNEASINDEEAASSERPGSDSKVRFPFPRSASNADVMEPSSDAAPFQISAKSTDVQAEKSVPVRAKSLKEQMAILRSKA